MALTPDQSQTNAWQVNRTWTYLTFTYTHASQRNTGLYLTLENQKRSHTSPILEPLPDKIEQMSAIAVSLKFP